MTYTLKVSKNVRVTEDEEISIVEQAIALITGIELVELYYQNNEIVGVTFVNKNPQYNYYLMCSEKLAVEFCDKIINRLTNVSCALIPNFCNLIITDECTLAKDVSRR